MYAGSAIGFSLSHVTRTSLPFVPTLPDVAQPYCGAMDGCHASTLQPLHALELLPLALPSEWRGNLRRQQRRPDRGEKFLLVGGRAKPSDVVCGSVTSWQRVVLLALSTSRYARVSWRPYPQHPSL